VLNGAIQAADLRALVAAGLALLLLAAPLLWLARSRGWRASDVLTPAEWRAAAGVAATIFLLLLLLRFHIATSFPAEQFIYGRF
jgi:hypothetical protein